MSKKICGCSDIPGLALEECRNIKMIPPKYKFYPHTKEVYDEWDNFVGHYEEEKGEIKVIISTNAR